jgi:hypothetical protein
MKKANLPPANQNDSDLVSKDEEDDGGNGGAEAHKEKIPPTTTNLISSDQQHKEKISSITEDNSSNPEVKNDSLELKKEEEIKFTPDYKAGEPIFLHLFKELSNENNGLVSYDKLQERLVSTGKFAGEAVLMIEYMEKIGEIEQTEQYHVYRRRWKQGSPH